MHTLRLLLSLVCFSPLLGSCDLAKITKSYLKVRIQGVYEAAASSQGSYEPRYQTYELQEIYLVAADGSQESLYTGTKDIIVNKRLLLLVDKEITSSLEGNSYNQLVVVLGTSVTGLGRAEEQDLTLASGTISYDNSFTIAKGLDYSFLIKVKWKGTVDDSAATETMTVPDFEIVQQ